MMERMPTICNRCGKGHKTLDCPETAPKKGWQKAKVERPLGPTQQEEYQEELRGGTIDPKKLAEETRKKFGYPEKK